MLGLPGSATPSGLCCNWVCTRPVRGPRGTLSSPTRRRRGGPATARRRRAGPGRGAARTGRSTSIVRRRAERTCGAWRRRTAVSGAEPTAVRGESKRWALGGPLGDRACRGAVHARVHGGRAKQGGIGRRGTCSLKVVEGARLEHLPSILSARARPAAPRGPSTVQMRARGGEGALAGAAAHHSAPPLLSARSGRRVLVWSRADELRGLPGLHSDGSKQHGALRAVSWPAAAPAARGARARQARSNGLNAPMRLCRPPPTPPTPTPRGGYLSATHCKCRNA